MVSMYAWLKDAIEKNYDNVRLLKKSSRGKVCLIRHKSTGQKMIQRTFTGNSEVYKSLLKYRCRNLPVTYEVASQGEENLILEEFVQGDTLGYLL